MGTAFMFYSNSNAWAEGLEGWHGVDQLGEDGANPNYNAMVERFEKRFGRSTRNVVVALAYDTARVAIHGIANAAIPHPKWVKEGMERIRWMPATNGGPGCYIQFGPWDRKGYKGDFLTIRELRGGELRFDGYHRPEWPSNAADSPRDMTTADRETLCADTAHLDAQFRGSMNDKVYIHEFIDIIGPNRARYMHHMTANWCPVALEERNQLCFGVWGTVGLDRAVARGGQPVGARRLGRPGGQLQPRAAPRLAAGSVAGPVVGRGRRPAPGWRRSHRRARTVDRTHRDADRPRRAGRGVRPRAVPVSRPGRSPAVLEQLATMARPAAEGLGATCVGAFDVAMVNESECLAIWALPDWSAWPTYEAAWRTGRRAASVGRVVGRRGRGDVAHPAGRRAAGAAAPGTPAPGSDRRPLDEL